MNELTRPMENEPVVKRKIALDMDDTMFDYLSILLKVWNTDEVHPDIIRVENWGQIVEGISNLPEKIS